jgi:hypothetical protein
MFPAFGGVVAQPRRLDGVISQATLMEIVEGRGSRWRPEGLLATLDEGPCPSLPIVMGWDRQRRWCWGLGLQWRRTRIQGQA